MDQSQLITGLATALVTFLGLFIADRRVKKAAKSSDSLAVYGDLQEDLKEMREERARDRDAAITEREKDRREMAYLQQLVLHLDNEIVALRNDIQVGAVPPLRPRPPRPTRPDWPVAS